jgi:hypothetical protein
MRSAAPGDGVELVDDIRAGDASLRLELACGDDAEDHRQQNEATCHTLS